MKVVTDTTIKVGTSFAKVVAGVAKKQRDPLLKWRPPLLKKYGDPFLMWRPPLLKKVDGSFAKVAAAVAKKSGWILC